VAGLRKAVGLDNAGAGLTKTLETCDDERLTNLFGALRWLGGRGRIGLAEPLKDGVTGLLTEALSVWKEASDNRRSQLDDGRDWETSSSSAIRNGGLVRV
jgi:hypothetical protein